MSEPITEKNDPDLNTPIGQAIVGIGDFILAVLNIEEITRSMEAASKANIQVGLSQLDQTTGFAIQALIQAAGLSPKGFEEGAFIEPNRMGGI